MNRLLIERNYNLHVSDIKLLDSHFGTEIYAMITDTGKYIVKVLPLSFKNASNEGPITEYLSGFGLKVAKLLKSKDGNYVIKTPDFQFTVQEYIEGETLCIYSGPEWFMEKSAEFLGKAASYLKDFQQLPLQFGSDFFSSEAAIKKKLQYIDEFAFKKVSSEYKTASIWENQIRHLDRISGFHIDTDKLTYSNSHGDFHIGQAIVTHHDITVIDWTSACCLPICLEVITSFVFAHPGCSEGSIDAAELKNYICTFSKHFPLSEYDIKAMPYVLYFWHCMCNYRPDEYADMAESYQPIAKLINNLLDWLYDHVDELSRSLLML